MPERVRRRAGAVVAGIVVDLLWAVLSPVLLAAYLLLSRGLTRAKYRRGLREKISPPPRRAGTGPCLWIHAVSVGEALIAEPLVRQLSKAAPDVETVISVSTYTGLDVARRSFPDHLVLWAPIDFGPVTGRALDRIRPDALVLLELELWPRWLLSCRARGIPVLVANGRMSERSCRRYRRAGPLSRALFRLVDAWGVQTADYARRIERVGVPADRIEVLGNIKYDRVPPPGADDPRSTRRELGWEDVLILVGGCTHAGEERALCALLARVGEQEPRLRLVLAPRHVERLGTGELERWGSPSALVRWSAVREKPRPLANAVLVVDTVGELERFYAAADLVFIGGSLIPRGGHNMLEATRLGRAVLFGPHHENFAHEAAVLLGAEAAIRVRDARELEERVVGLLADPEARASLGKRAAEATAGLRGAAERHIAWLGKTLPLFLPRQS